MSVAPVDGYGPITQSNAAEIYKDRNVYNNLDEAQKRLVERYVPKEERDEIDYELQGVDAKKNGKDKIEDNKKAEKHGSQAGNAIGMTAANLAAITGSVWLLSVIDGFSQLAFSLICAAMAVVNSALAKAFDNGYKDRTSASDNSDSTNETLDAQNSTLQESMDMMDEDYQNYLEDSNKLMKETNENNSQLGDLQIQLKDAQAAGDRTGVQRIKGEIQKRQQNDFAQEKDALDEKKNGLEDYRTINSESDGVIEAGTNVSDFLKQGTALGVIAGINGLANYAAGILVAVAYGSTFAKLAPFFPDAAACSLGKVQGGIAAAMFAVSGTVWMAKAKKELECGSNGREMEGHVNALSAMKDQQTQYTDTTEESYGTEDEQRDETIQEGLEQINKNTSSYGAGGVGNNPNKNGKDKDKDGKQGAGSPSTAGAAA